MGYVWLDDYCRLKKGAEKDFKAEWDATRYMLRGEMFAMQGSDKSGKAIITLKLEPSHGQLLREQYKDVTPGYYMNKEHWNSVYLDGTVPDDLLKDMVDESYTLILNANTKKVRDELLGN